MSAPGEERGGWLARAARMVAAPVISGSVGAIVFLVMIQGSFRKDHTTLDFNHVLGTLISGETAEAGGTTEALGVVGDRVGPTGLLATVLGGIALMVIHELVITRLVRRHWLVQAIPLWVLTVIAVGVVFPAAADARFDTPTGLLGTDAGSLGPLVILLSSAGFALVGARIHALAAGARWWQPHHEGIGGTSLEQAAGLDAAPSDRP